MEPAKSKYGRAYWLQQLITIGKLIEPDKYTPEYLVRVTKAWQSQPITKLHMKVLRRRKEHQTRPA